MFLPDGSEHGLRLPGCSSDGNSRVFCVVGNRDRTLYAAVTSSTVYIFLANPQLVLCTYRRPFVDIEEKGEYRILYWRHDSSAVCTTTSKNCLLIYHVDISSNKQCYNLIEPRDEQLRRTSQELFIKERRPRVEMSLSVVARLDSPATCVVPLREELFVCLRDGWMHRIFWDGTVEESFSFHLSEIPFAVDQLQSKPEHIRDRSVHVVDVVYTPLIGGFCSVLSDGRSALLTSPSPRFHPKQLLAVWALQMTDAVCTSTNHKFRLIIFGCRNGDIAAYHLDDANGALTCAYRVKLRIKDGPELLNNVGCVSHVECFSHGSAFAAVWSPLEKTEMGSSSNPVPPVLAIFSPFGSQLWCSLESIADRGSVGSDAYRWVDWGPEGFSLWLGADSGLSVLSISRSVSVNNPNMEHFARIALLSSSRIYISPAKEKEQSASAPHSVWNIFSVPNDYLSANWPLRLVSIDHENGRWLVAAGTRGFAHCNIATGKWRLFGNESQEQDVLITGGVAVWRGFVVAACYDINRDKEELRFYPVDRQLDNQFCTRHTVESRVLMLSQREDKVITFDMDARIFIYGFSLKERGKNYPDTVIVERCAEIRVNDLVPHPACVVSIQLTSLNNDSSAAKFCDDVDTVLINVSGRLIMLSPLKKEVINADSDDDDDHFQLNHPMLIASYVEQMWHDVTGKTARSHSKPHLTQALWLNCGAKGMKVWMPLFLGQARRHSIGAIDSNRSFINKRIMLPFELDICPLVICSHDCLALGVESSPSFPGSRSLSARSAYPLYSLHRNSEVFLHHLLRQLLKRNLGVYALEIAATCTHLPYFGHVLELLLHNVLEEEATSSEPIPDPLLPRVVAFIQEFPNFLQTVAHCARKTELALWHALFAVTNHPKELFEVCIRDGQLETAASFLIVLQNMESSIASREHAAVLLEEALMKRRFLIARDIVRFLRAIDPSDIDSPPRTPPCQKPHQNVVSAVTRRATLVSSDDTEETDSFIYGSYTPGIISRPRQSHSESFSGAPVATRKDSSKLIKGASVDSPPSALTSPSSMHDYLEEILKKHAAHLLEDCSIRDLGAFAAYLDFNLSAWLADVRSTLAKISDFGLALMRLHAQFKWPYPLVSQAVVDQLTKCIEGMKTSQSCASLASFQSSSAGASKLSSPVSEKRLSIFTDSSSAQNFNGEASCSVSTFSGSHVESGAGSGADSSSETVVVPLRQADEFPYPEEGLRPISPCSISGETISNSSSDWEGLERICGEAAARGTQESEVELKFMLELMYGAGCADWTLLLCLLRRDFAFLNKRITLKFIEFCGADTIERLLSGFEQLALWANSSCFGYRTLIVAFERHLQLLAESKKPSQNHGRHAAEDKVRLAADESKKVVELQQQQKHVYNGLILPKHPGSAVVAEKSASSPNGNAVVSGKSWKDLTLSNGDRPLVLNQYSLQTPARSELVNRTFTPPREDGNKSDQEGNFGELIQRDEVVSHVSVDEREQCSLM